MALFHQEITAQVLISEAKYYYEQKRLFKEKMMGDCDIYIISNRWIYSWKIYVSYRKIKFELKNQKKNLNISLSKKDKPSAIDNSDLFIPFNTFVNNGNTNNQYNYIIPENKKQNKHFRCISKEIWEHFEFKYSGGPMIIKHKKRNSTIEDYLYSIKLNVLIFPSKENFTYDYIRNLQSLVFYVSPNESIQEFKQSMILTLKTNNCQSVLEQYHLDRFIIPEQFNLLQLQEFYDLKMLIEYYKTNYKEIKMSNHPLRSIMSFSFDLETIKDSTFKSINKQKGLLILEYKQSNYSSNNNQTKITDSKRNIKTNRSLSTNIQIGLSGLINLGNTCFMNASIQCLSNCGLLTDYFLKDYYKSHLNKNNPLGSKGILVSAYAELLKRMWNGSNMPISPNQLKSAISSFQSLFNGYSQHDTHEFLIYLLDGLHEDLNLVLKKPYIKEEDFRGNDDELYKFKLIHFLKRNQSIIGDLFYGIYKSTIYCLNESCGNVMRVFEPYLSVNVPLTVNNMTCFFLFYDISITPIEIQIPLENDRYLGSLRIKLSMIFNVKPFSFLMAYISNKGELTALYSSDKPLREIDRIFCFQINPSFTNETLCDFSKIYTTMEERKKEIYEILNQDELIQDMPSKQSISYTKSTNLLVNIDNNNYLPISFIKVILHLFIYSPNEKKKIMFPRIIYIKKEMTTHSLYQEIINYFSHLLEKRNGLNHKENIFSKCFPNLNLSLQNKTEISENEQIELNYPFLLQFKRVNEKNKCYYCGKLKCQGCLIPCNDNITISDILSEEPNYEKDNTYYYISNLDKEKYKIINSDFEIEVIWLNKYESIITTLNNRKILNFSESEEDIPLIQCLKRFEYAEILDGENKVHCSKCNKFQKVQKQLELYTAPHYLIIQLKRFNKNGKITNKVNFPLYDFNLSKYVKKKEKDDSLLEYDLIGIANHNGHSNGGHYVAYAKNYVNNNWYEFDDANVSHINENKLITLNAYILIYERKNMNTHLNKDTLYTKRFIDYSAK